MKNSAAPSPLNSNYVPMASAENIYLTDRDRDQKTWNVENTSNETHSNMPQSGEGEHEQMALSRANGGRDAFLFLAGSFMIEALLWGKPPMRRSSLQSVTKSS